MRLRGRKYGLQPPGKPVKANLLNRPTIERIRQVLAYEPDTGILRWRITSGRAIAGNEAGCLDKSTGYIRVRVDKTFILAHHICWALTYGCWPERLDHRHGKAAGNGIENLRECTQSQNLGNMERPKHNTSGIKGVSFHKDTGQWLAQIGINGKKTYLGIRPTKEAAAALYAEAAANHFGSAFSLTEDRPVHIARAPRRLITKSVPRPTAEQIRSVLAYDRLTGLLTWKRALSFRGQVGSVAGRLNADGYVRIGLFGRQYQAHILAWVIETGSWPELIIHHADAVRDNNRWGNLSEITQAENVRAGHALIRALTAPLYRRKKVA